MEKYSTPLKKGLKPSQSKCSEIGNMAMVKNKNQGLQLMKSLECYDKQRAKAARSIEFAKRSFKDNLKSLNSKLVDGQFDDTRFGRFKGDRRRQSSPSTLSVDGSIDLRKGNILQEREVEMPLRASGARNHIQSMKRLSIHRHSLPEDKLYSLNVVQTSKANKDLSLRSDNISISSKNLLKSSSWSNIDETLGQPKHNLNDLKSVSFSLSKIDSLENIKKPKSVSFAVLPSIKTSKVNGSDDNLDSAASGSLRKEKASSV
ncbi:hypothetical protein AC249_AIPGENE20175 [Exaiptasia diaphana]|nr:hypothetical protein AC249_AIPGENE20175 [Exaiptasia diaphana]